MKLYSDIPYKKIQLNSKYIKMKKDHKLKAKFFGSFQVLYPVGKEAYTLEQPANQRIHDVFPISLPEQDITKNGRVNKLLKLKLELDIGEDKKYKVDVIKDSAIYKKAAKD